MQLEAIKHQGSRTSGQIDPKDAGKRSNEIVAERNKMAVKQVQRYIPVSYTHLDVYKRQVFLHIVVHPHTGDLIQADEHRLAAGPKVRVCLLYTSFQLEDALCHIGNDTITVRIDLVFRYVSGHIPCKITQHSAPPFSFL